MKRRTTITASLLLGLFASAGVGADDPSAAEQAAREAIDIVNRDIPAGEPPVAPPPEPRPPQTAEQAAQEARDIVHSQETMAAKQAARDAQMARDSMDPATRESWQRYINNDYSGVENADAVRKKDFLRLQRDWDQVQAEAHKGNITPEQNTQFLQDHAKDLKRRMAAAGAKHDLGVAMQTPSGEMKTYSDTDLHGRPVWRSEEGNLSTGQQGEMRVEQFEAARRDFNDAFNQDLRDSGLATVDNSPGHKSRNPSEKMRVDLMPVTDDQDLFSKVERHINEQGGVMYQDPEAVRQELANRAKNPDGSPAPDGTSAETKARYLQEQIRQQRSHAREAEELLEHANRTLNDPAATPAQKREALRQIEMSQGEGSSLIGKYEDRANKIINKTAQQAGTDVQGIDVDPQRQTAIDAVGKTRDKTVTQQSAEIIATTDNAIRNQQIEGARVLFESGEIAAAAEVARNADASTRGEIIEQARRVSPEQAEALAAEMRRNSVPDEFDPETGRWKNNSQLTPDAPSIGGRAVNMGRRAVNAAGEAMAAADTLNAGQDIIDYQEGRISAAELAERLGSRIPVAGDAYSAGRLVGDRAQAWSAAQENVAEANARIQAAWAQEAAVQARQQGASTEEATALREALSSGDEAAVAELLDEFAGRGIDYAVPTRPEEYTAEADDTAWERTQQIGEGMYQSGERAVGFVRDTASRGAEIARETGRIVAGEIQANSADQERLASAAALRRQLEEQGVDSDRALSIAQDYYEGDTSSLRDLRDERRAAAAQSASTDADDLAGMLLAAADEGGNPMDGTMVVEAEEYGAAFSSADASNQQLTNEEFVISSGRGEVEVSSIDDFLAAADAREAAAEAQRRQESANARMANDSAWSDALQAMDTSNMTQDQAAQQSLASARQDGQALLDAAANRPDPRLSADEFATQIASLEQEAVRLDDERNQILSNPGGDAAPLDPNQGGQYGGAAIQAALSGNETGFDVRQAACNDVVKSGGNNPASISIASQGFQGSATLSFDHYGVKDRIAVISGGGVIFDSGCVPHKGGSQLSVPAMGQIKVIVEPNCDQTSNSQWEFKVSCNDGLAQQ